MQTGVYARFDCLISIHALRVEGDLLRYNNNLRIIISIHALRVEGDIERHYMSIYLKISIHALRVEGDLSSCRHLHRLSHFYPRPPGGGRPERRFNDEH